MQFFTLFVLHYNLFSERRCFTISTKEQLINEEINEKEVRVIGADNEQLGIMSSAQALDMAIEANLDLVLIAPQATPPVCRIMDYGKFRFEQSKKEKESRKNQKQADQAIKFLKNGDKVRIKVRYRRARELSHANLGEELMQRVLDTVAEYGTCEKPAKLEGKNYMAVVAPKTVAGGKKAKKDADKTAETK